MKLTQHGLRLLAGLALATTGAKAIPYVYQLDDDFESTSLGSLPMAPWRVEHVNNEPGNVYVQNVIARTGARAVALINNYTDPNGGRIRTEMNARDAGTLAWDQEYWVGFSFYLKDWTPSDDPEIVHQFHAIPHDYDWSVAAARNLSTLFIQGDVMTYQAITTPNTGAALGGAAATPVWAEPVRTNVWQDWVLHIVPSQTSNGLLEVWKDGKRIHRQYGANVDPYDTAGLAAFPAHYFKAGVYNWPWKTKASNVTRREILYDEVRIGHVEAGYTGGYLGVAPNGGAITFGQSGDVSTAFPTGILQGGNSHRAFDPSTSRMRLHAQGSDTNHININANAYSDERFSGALDFISEGRTITFYDVTVLTRQNDASNIFGVGIGNAATGNFLYGSGPSRGIYFKVECGGGRRLKLMLKGQSAPLASWNLPEGPGWDFDYLSLSLTTTAWTAKVRLAGESEQWTQSGDFPTPITASWWGGDKYHLGMQAAQTNTSVEATGSFTDGLVGSIEISPIPRDGRITFVRESDVAEMFPKLFVQGGASRCGFDEVTNRMLLHAQGNAASSANINVNAYGNPHAGLNFISSSGRIITFKDVTMETQPNGTTNMLGLGVCNGASGNFMYGSGPSGSVYFKVDCKGTNKLRLIARGPYSTSTTLSSWTLPAGSRWDFTYLSLTVTNTDWSARIQVAGSSETWVQSGSFPTPYTAEDWGPITTLACRRRRPIPRLAPRPLSPRAMLARSR